MAPSELSGLHRVDMDERSLGRCSKTERLLNALEVFVDITDFSHEYKPISGDHN